MASPEHSYNPNAHDDNPFEKSRSESSETEPTEEDLMSLEDEVDNISVGVLDSLADIDITDSVGLFFKSLPPFHKLTRDEEVELGKRIEEGKRFKNQSYETLTAQEQALVQDAQLAREELANANLRLVIHIAKRYKGDQLELLDIIQEGNRGLMKAVDKYDYNRGFKFSTYATWWIRQHITRSLHDSDRTIRVPTQVSILNRKIMITEEQLHQKLTRPPTHEELVKELDSISLYKLEKAIRLTRRVFSLDKPFTNGDSDHERSYADIIPDNSPSPIESVARSQLSEQFATLLAIFLTEREAQVLRYLYGFHDGSSYILEDVATILGVSRERIRQIKEKALFKLRKKIVSKYLIDFLQLDEE